MYKYIWKNHKCIYIYIYLNICIYIYIYIYMSRYQIGYIFMYNRCKFIVDLWLVLNYQKCELFIVNIPEISFAIWINMILSFGNIIFCLSFLHLQYRKCISVIHQAWKSGVCYWPISIPNNITRQYQRRILNSVNLLQWSSFTKIVNG